MSKESAEPLNNTTLMLRLEQRGINCDLETEFEYFFDLTREKGRILCAELVPPIRRGTVFDSGISFWLHAGSGLLFLGIWTGVCFEVGDSAGVVELALEILGSRTAKEGYSPYKLPTRLLEKYRLQYCTLFRLWPGKLGERLEDLDARSVSGSLSSDTFINKLSRKMDICRLRNDGFLVLALGAATALARFSPDSPKPQVDIPLLVRGRISSTRDHGRLLRTLIVELCCTLYETGWGNRVDLDDPYYAFDVSGNRPNEPMNAWPANNT